MKGLDLRKFKKVSSDGNTTTFKHYAGHEIKIAHNKLSKSMKEQIEKLPGKKQHFEDGGEVQADAPLDPAQKRADSAQRLNMSKSEMKAIDSTPPAPENSSDREMDMHFQDPQRGPAGYSGPAQMPEQAAPMYNPYDAAAQGAGVEKQKLEQGMQGFEQSQKGQADIISRGADVAASEAMAQNKKLSDMHLHNEEAGKEILGRRKAVIDDINAGHISPNHYWEGPEAHSKVMAGIGLILGGMGSHSTGGQNVVANFIDKQIDRDVAAQKAELGKKENLLSANFKEMGDLRDAENMTRINLTDIYSNQLQRQAAQQQGALAGPRSAQAISEMQMKNAPILGSLQEKLARSRMMQKMMSGPQGSDPSAMVRMIVPEPHQKAVFDEIERAQNTRKMGSAILEAFDQAAKDNTVLRTGAGQLRTPPSVLALHQAMQPTFKDLEGTVRMAAMENTFKNVTPSPGDFDSSTQTKRQALVDYLQSKSSAPTAKGFGIDLNKFSSTTPHNGGGTIKSFRPK